MNARVMAEHLLLVEPRLATRRSTCGRVLRHLQGDPLMVAAAVWLALLVVLGLAMPTLLQGDAPADSYVPALNVARSALLTGGLAIAASLLLALTLGVWAGFRGGLVHAALERAMQVPQTFPLPMLTVAAVAVSTTRGGAAAGVVAALMLAVAPPLLQVAMAETRHVCALPYVDAARMTGDSTWGIVRAHVLGHVLGPVLVRAAALAGYAVVLAAGLCLLVGGSGATLRWMGPAARTAQQLPASAMACQLVVLLLALGAAACAVLAAGLRRAILAGTPVADAA